MSLVIAIDDAANPTVSLSGRLDTHTAPDLDKALNELFARRAQMPRLVFDLGQLDYLSSAGIR